MSWVSNCRAWCKEVKGLSEPIEWVEKPSRSNYLLATSGLLNAKGVTIPHLIFKGEYRICKHGDILSYALMYRHAGELRRVFMVEIYPLHQRSHIEPNGVEFFGPHMHLGDERLEQISKVVLDRVGNVFHKWWIDKLRRHARIGDTVGGYLMAPMGDGLFST